MHIRITMLIILLFAFSTGPACDDGLSDSYSFDEQQDQENQPIESCESDEECSFYIGAISGYTSTGGYSYINCISGRCAACRSEDDCLDSSWECIDHGCYNTCSGGSTCHDGYVRLDSKNCETISCPSNQICMTYGPNQLGGCVYLCDNQEDCENYPEHPYCFEGICGECGGNALCPHEEKCIPLYEPVSYGTSTRCYSFHQH